MLENDEFWTTSIAGKQSQGGAKAKVGVAVRQVFKNIGNVVQGQREPEISNPTISSEAFEACKSKFKLVPLQSAADNEDIARREEDFERRDRELAERRMNARAKRTQPIIGLPFGRPSNAEVRAFQGLWSS